MLLIVELEVYYGSERKIKMNHCRRQVVNIAAWIQEQR